MKTVPILKRLRKDLKPKGTTTNHSLKLHRLHSKSLRA
nr:MAG TPA: hypothetical protein [Caudoviricetes sp.]